MWTEDKIRQRIVDTVITPLEKKGLDREFVKRFNNRFPLLWKQYSALYGNRFDCLYQLEDLISMMAGKSLERPEILRELDKNIDSENSWFGSRESVAMMLYVDLFSGNLSGFEEKLPYLTELGVNVVHLMPLFRAPEKENDGGYAVSDYQVLRKELGTMEQFSRIALKMRAEGMHVILDFVLNHTSDEHEWARRAGNGEKEFEEYYFLFDRREEADEYDRTLREIFPSVRKGCFTYREDYKKWVWTTFSSYQWDLNYGNPGLFKAMCEQMLFLSNHGTDVLRFDALAFTWKKKGTGCENLPETHTLIQLFRSVAAVAAPGLSFLSEAIVHPDEVVRYISPDECLLSYNPLQMATTWEALATRNTSLLKKTFSPRFAIPERCRWVNYLRCHDDIGWTFCDYDASALGYNPFEHRHFLNRFYTGRFEGSFASGVPFQENTATGDARVSGTLASLAGLEKAERSEDPEEKEMALNRIKLLFAYLFSLPGIPLIYSGDELAVRNDYSYMDKKEKNGDSRWVHRFPFPWGTLENPEEKSFSREVFEFVKKMIRLRRENPAMEGQMNLIETDSSNLLSFRMADGSEHILIFANFTERPTDLLFNILRLYGGAYRFRDLLSDRIIEGDFTIGPYELYWLKEELA